MLYVAGIRTVDEESKQQIELDLYMGDDETGNSLKSVCEVPGAYDEVCDALGVNMYLVKFENGKIVTASGEGEYATSMMGLVMVPKDEESAGQLKLSDVGTELSQMLSMPPTAAQVMLGKMPEQNRKILKEATESIRYAEQLTEESSVCLPDVAFEIIGDDVRKKMAARKLYVLKKADNEERFQKDCTSEYLVELPSVTSIHNNSNSVSSLDLLRVTAPYRQAKNNGTIYAYDAIYHTPYYKVDPRIRGYLPTEFKWIEGYHTNDDKGIQPYEKKMADNLYMLVCEDVSRNVANILTSILLRTPFGISLQMLFSAKDMESFCKIQGELSERAVEGCKCELTLSEMENVVSEGCRVDDIARLVKEKLQVSDEYLTKLVEQRNEHMDAYDISSLRFALNLTDEQKNKYTEMFIQGGVMTSAMFDFLRNMCSSAYALNWGWTGDTKAIPNFVDVDKLKAVSDQMAMWVNVQSGKLQQQLQPKDVNLLVTESDDEIDVSDDGEIDDGIMHFDHYLSRNTISRMRMAELSADYFNRVETMSAEDMVVERWRKTNGDNNLYLFLAEVYATTSSPMALIECFIKIMRWGEMRPRVLTLPEYPEVKRMFMFEDGSLCVSYDSIDESKLIKVSGCRYSLKAMLYASSNIVSANNPMVGLLLQEDYGEIVRYVLASWNDLYDMIEHNNIDIADIKTMSKLSMDIVEHGMAIEEFQHEKHVFYNTDAHISEAFDRKMPAEDLNDLALLTTPNIISTPKYVKSLRNTEIITGADLQYANLRKYLRALDIFYAECASQFEKMSHAGELVDLAKKFHEIYVNCDKPKTAAGAGAGASAMSLDLGSAVKFVDGELNGKFILVYDDTMTAPFVPMTFSDPMMEAASKQLHNRIVLLLMDGEKLMFCQKDIKLSEVVRNNGVLAVQKYSLLGKAVDALAAGKVVRLSKKDTFLHSSLRQYF